MNFQDLGYIALSQRAYTYDEFGRAEQRIIRYQSTPLLTDTYEYVVTDNGETSQVHKILRDGVDSDADVTYTYTYDKNGNIASVSDGTNKTEYAYDTANQLVQEKNQAEGKIWEWEYDNAGNITCRREYNYSTGALIDTVQYGYDETWGDLLKSYDGQNITYDEIGNPTSYYNGTRWTMTWEHGRELATISNGSTTWTNTYDADGLRTKRTNGTTTYTYVYDGGRLTQVVKNGTNMRISYDANGPISLKYQNATYQYVTNLQGDVVALLDTAGNVVVEYVYDAWGNILDINDTTNFSLGTSNPLRYRGYVYDTETGLYYLQSRYYDPKVGRFLNADAFASTGQGLLGNNMFAYCSNNPVNCCDPTGYYRFDIEPCAFSDGNGGNDTAVPLNPIYTKTKGLINGQKVFEYSAVSFGWGTLGNNGCGPIAVYNAMQLLGHRASLGLIADYFQYGSGLWVCGLFGITPSSIKSYFANRGISCTGYSSYSELKANISEGAVVLFMVMNDASNPFAGCHYMTAQYKDGQFICYNIGNYRTQSISIPTLEPVYGNAGWIYGYILGG